MSDFRFHREYRGEVKTLVLDWSGTTADAYVIAPAIVFAEVFRNQGVEVSMNEARGPMGLRKDLHIEQLTLDPIIRERWKTVHGKYPDQNDVDRMFADFVPAQVACLPKYTDLLPETAEVTQRLQKKGIKIGVSTGFTRVMVDVLLEAAIKQGFTPDATVAGDEVINGARPKPFMVYRNLDLLDAWPIESVVKVDDTVGGVGEGLNAGCWAVGVSRYSNYMLINSREEEAALSEKEIQRRVETTRQKLQEAGAHYVIESIADIEPVIADINTRLARGEKP
ncbi:MAG TPA: phosphonoacetaldehyde hydrolase [Planctomycetes bacterium]|nr:phosphonoacetaldehyde hydrolase [Fuerstiella sp.]HIK94163.1 phosphonoacetaldehyde hydrolase [Planctomycetota bacterium]